MTPRQLSLLFLAIAVVGLVFGSAFTVDEREKVVVVQLGKIKGTDYAPGLHLKWPVIDEVRRFDGRILTLDNKEERFLTLEKKNLVVDFFVKWRIKDVGSYFRATGGDEAKALDRLSKIIKGGLRDEFGARTVQQAVSGERTEIMKKLATAANPQLADMGIEVVDVRIKRIDLPDQVTRSVYERMESERKRVANDLRARGDEAAERIRADADRQREVILAEAYREAEKIRGQGDAEAAEIYARAYGRNPEFYSFYRSLAVYQNTLRSKDDVLVLEPEGEFFRYFNPPAGGR
ncbi:MAG TPA: protease modulator HflC [Nevskiales bacterium]|nr:protease modulator HflC [Nevskiales bacterium]